MTCCQFHIFIDIQNNVMTEMNSVTDD
jgi:hypothetical protein